MEYEITMFETLHDIYGKEKEMLSSVKLWKAGIVLVLFVFAWWLQAGAEGDPFESANVSEEAALSEIVSANTRFGFKLYQELIKQDGKNNIFASPLSVSLALSMCCNGADGETQKVMAKALELENLPLSQVNEAYAGLMDTLLNLGTDVQLSLANSLWADEDVLFKESFLKEGLTGCLTILTCKQSCLLSTLYISKEHGQWDSMKKTPKRESLHRQMVARREWL